MPHQDEAKLPAIQIKERGAFGGFVRQVSGYVGTRQVIQVSFATDGDAPRVDMSSSLPVNFDEAAVYVTCFHQVFARVRELQANLVTSGGGDGQ